MKRFHYALITAAFAALLLSACGSADTDTAGSSGDNFLVVLNYGKYLDSSAIKMFEQETGIKIKLEEYESPEEMYTKFSAGSISYDVVRTLDYMVERLIHEGKVAPIDFSSFSYYKNLDPAILAAAEVFDPQNQYSMPYFYGTLGILYNTTMVSEEETESWNILWDDRYRDTIIMQNSVRDSFVPALRLLGRDINTEDETDLRDALSLLVEQKPLIYAYYVDETADEMIAGNAALALVLLPARRPPPWSPTPISPTRFRRRDPTSGSIPGSFRLTAHTRKTPKSFWIFWAARTSPCSILTTSATPRQIRPSSMRLTRTPAMIPRSFLLTMSLRTARSTNSSAAIPQSFTAISGKH